MDKINFYKTIDSIRKQKGISTNELCEGLISERTYYRHLKGEESVKFDSLALIIDRLHISLTELVVQEIINQTIDAPNMNMFVHNIYNLDFDDMKPFFEQVSDYESDNYLYQKFIETNLYKYRYLTKELSALTYSKFLKKIVYNLSDVSNTNIYKLYIEMELFSVSPSSYAIPKLMERVMMNDFCKKPLLAIIIFDNFLNVVIPKKLVELKDMEKLYKKYRGFIRYFNILRSFTKFDLYRAYIEQYAGNKDLSKKYLIKYVNGIIVTDGGRFVRDELKIIEKNFGINYKDLINQNQNMIFYNPDSRFVIVNEKEKIKIE